MNKVLNGSLILLRYGLDEAEGRTAGRQVRPEQPCAHGPQHQGNLSASSLYSRREAQGREGCYRGAGRTVRGIRREVLSAQQDDRSGTGPADRRSLPLWQTCVSIVDLRWNGPWLAWCKRNLVRSSQNRLFYQEKRKLKKKMLLKKFAAHVEGQIVSDSVLSNILLLSAFMVIIFSDDTITFEIYFFPHKLQRNNDIYFSVQNIRRQFSYPLWISTLLCDSFPFRHNKDKTLLVWINEEDHTRIISMQKGGDMIAVFRRFCEGISKVRTTH